MAQYCCGDAILVVCLYIYLTRCAVTPLVLINARMCNISVKNIKHLVIFFFPNSQVKHFFWLMRHVTKLRNVIKSLFLWDCVSCCWRRWSNGDLWCCFWRRWSNRYCQYCCWRRWSNGDCSCCCWRRFFPFKHFCKVSRVLSSSL